MDNEFTMLTSGSTISAQFSDKKQAHRYVMHKSGTEKIDWRVKWGADCPGILRCVVQSPDGRVLYDGSNEGCCGSLLFPGKSDNELHGTIYASSEGLFSVYVTPIALCSAKYVYSMSQDTSPRDGGDEYIGRSEHHLWATSSRKWPCVFVVDRGKSMTNGDIDTVEQSISSALNKLRTDPMALETVYLSFISFSLGALIHSSLVDLFSYELPIIGRDPHNDSDISAALKSIAFFHAAYVTPWSAWAKGDWKPNVFLFTNGKCLSGIGNMAALKQVNLIVCAVGNCSMPDNINQLTESVVRVGEPGDFGSHVHSFFKVVS